MPTAVKAPKSYHITPILRSLHWLKINERIKYYKLLSLTYKVLTTSQPDPNSQKMYQKGPHCLHIETTETSIVCVTAWANSARMSLFPVRYR